MLLLYLGVFQHRMFRVSLTHCQSFKNWVCSCFVTKLCRCEPARLSLCCWSKYTLASGNSETSVCTLFVVRGPYHSLYCVLLNINNNNRVNKTEITEKYFVFAFAKRTTTASLTAITTITTATTSAATTFLLLITTVLSGIFESSVFQSNISSASVTDGLNTSLSLNNQTTLQKTSVSNHTRLITPAAVF